MNFFHEFLQLNCTYFHARWHSDTSCHAVWLREKNFVSVLYIPPNSVENEEPTTIINAFCYSNVTVCGACNLVWRKWVWQYQKIYFEFQNLILNGEVKCKAKLRSTSFTLRTLVDKIKFNSIQRFILLKIFISSNENALDSNCIVPPSK